MEQTCLERVRERRPRENVNTDKMQFGFMPEMGTTDATGITRLMQMFSGRKRTLFSAFVDLDKASDR